MKTRAWKILTKTTLLALAMFGLTPSAEAAPPSYLNEMPSVARVLSEVQGTNALDTAARQAGVFEQLVSMMGVLEGQREFGKQTPDELRLEQAYRSEDMKIQFAVQPKLQAEKTSATGMNTPWARWLGTRTDYSENTAYVLNKFFSPQWQSEYRAAARQENQSSQAGSPTTGTPVSQGNQNSVTVNSGVGGTASSGGDATEQHTGQMLATIASFGIIAISLLSLFGLGLLLFWVWMIIDCLVHEHDNKIAWLILIIFVNWVGALIYYAVRRSARKREARQKAVAQ